MALQALGAYTVPCLQAEFLISDVQSGLFVLTLEPDSMAICPGDAVVLGDVVVDQPGRWIGQASGADWFSEDILWVEAFESSDCPACMGDLMGTATSA